MTIKTSEIRNQKSEIERMDIEDIKMLEKFISLFLAVYYSILKAKDPGSIELAYKVSKNITKLTPKSIFEQQSEWLNSVVDNANIPEKLNKPGRTIEEEMTLIFGETKPLEPLTSVDKPMSSKIAKFHTFIRCNHDYLHTILGVGTSQLEEVIVHLVMTETMPSPISAHLIGVAPRYLYKILSPLNKSYEQKSIFFKMARQIAKKIASGINNSKTNVTQVDFANTQWRKCNLEESRKYFGITPELQEQIKNFINLAKKQDGFI